MGGEGDAAGDILTGAVIASTVEGVAGAAGKADPAAHGACRNCGAMVDGAYCSACGQRAQLHRSLLSLGHDILHGVFHFEGKMWRTLPELFFHPGRLTRRYINGERAKFVSPMALYLFTVFLMFGVFSFTSSDDLFNDADGSNFVTNWMSAGIWGTALGIVPPIHLYKQLRGAYGLSRFGAWTRLFLLSIGISIVLVIFFLLLMLIGIIS